VFFCGLLSVAIKGGRKLYHTRQEKSRGIFKNSQFLHIFCFPQFVENLLKTFSTVLVIFSTAVENLSTKKSIPIFRDASSSATLFYSFLCAAAVSSCTPLHVSATLRPLIW